MIELWQECDGGRRWQKFKLHFFFPETHQATCPHPLRLRHHQKSTLLPNCCCVCIPKDGVVVGSVPYSYLVFYIERLWYKPRKQPHLFRTIFSLAGTRARKRGECFWAFFFLHSAGTRKNCCCVYIFRDRVLMCTKCNWVCVFWHYSSLFYNKLCSRLLDHSILKKKKEK